LTSYSQVLATKKLPNIQLQHVAAFARPNSHEKWAFYMFAQKNAEWEKTVFCSQRLWLKYFNAQCNEKKLRLLKARPFMWV